MYDYLSPVLTKIRCETAAVAKDASDPRLAFECKGEVLIFRPNAQVEAELEDLFRDCLDEETGAGTGGVLAY